MQITLNEGANATFYDIHDNQNVYIGSVKGTPLGSQPQPIADAGGGFQSCILQKETEDRLLAALHRLMDGKQGKQAVLVLRCASQLGLITMPTYHQAKEEFPQIGASSGYYRYLAFPFNESETAPVSKAIRKMMEEE